MIFNKKLKMAISKNKRNELIDVVAEKVPVGNRKSTLIAIIILSSGLDLILSMAELPWIVVTLGGAVVFEEIVEYFISKLLAKHTINLEITKTERALGFIPIPGVTALSIKCIKLLMKERKEKG